VIIVRRRGELIRFALFLVALGLVVYFVATRWDAWHLAQDDSVLPAVEPSGEPLGEVEPLPGLEPRGLLSEEAQPKPSGAGLQAVEDFFAEFRMTRDRSRSALRETLREVMENPAVGPEAQEAAGEEYLMLGRYASLEEQAEALVKARGFADAVVHIAGESAQVVVKSQSLTRQEAAQVADTVSRVTGVKEGAIQVMARER